MTIGDIQELLKAMSQVLVAIKDFPVFEEVTDDNSYYTMSDVGIGDAIQALNEIAQGIEDVNHPPESFSDLCLTQDLKHSIATLGGLSMAIIRADRESRPCENKAAAKEAARQDGHDVLEWV